MCNPRINHDIISVASSIVPDPPGNIKNPLPISNNFFFLSLMLFTVIVFVIFESMISIDDKNLGIIPITSPPELIAE